MMYLWNDNKNNMRRWKEHCSWNCPKALQCVCSGRTINNVEFMAWVSFDTGNQLHLSAFCYREFSKKSCLTSFKQSHCNVYLVSVEEPYSYLQTHLDSNSVPLHNTHGQLCSILWCYSWFHSRKQAIPWYKLSCSACTENWVYSVFRYVTNILQV